MTDKPTCDDLLNGDGFTLMQRQDDASWRHGSYVTEVFLRDSDNTCWKVCYRLSTDGETNELREGHADIRQCWPKDVVTTVFVDNPND